MPCLHNTWPLSAFLNTLAQTLFFRLQRSDALRCSLNGQLRAATGTGRRRLASEEQVLQRRDRMMLTVREFMGAVADELAMRGTSARDLVALQFEAGSFDLRVIVRPEPHPASYPELVDIFDIVSETCEQDGIALSDITRITFFDTEINLECSGVDGAVYTYPLEPVTVH